MHVYCRESRSAGIFLIAHGFVGCREAGHGGEEFPLLLNGARILCGAKHAAVVGHRELFHFISPVAPCSLRRGGQQHAIPKANYK